MKANLILLVCLVIAEVGFCQTVSPHVKNTTALKKTESLTDGRMMPEKLDSMHQVLANAATNRERADLCYAICLYFASRLKIDSALFYCDRIKKESEIANYELGLAKYYISRSYTLFYRNVQEPEGLNKGIEILHPVDFFFLFLFLLLVVYRTVTFYVCFLEKKLSMRFNY